MSHDAMINNLLRSALGMNSLVNRLNSPAATNSFPPYNILVDDDKNPSKYTLEMAVAGFSKDQISVKLRKDQGVNYLIINGEKADTSENRFFAVRGLAARAFEREFTMADGIKVDSISLVDGILTIELSTTEPLKTETILQIQ